MKLFATIALLGTAASSVSAFAPPSNQRAVRTTSLLATADTDSGAVDRRSFAASVGLAFLGAASLAPSTAQASGYFDDTSYVPQFEDLKQIYVLGVTLDRLAEKLSNVDTIDKASEGLKQFNKDPNFYPGYALNYVKKIVKRSADEDPRVVYIAEAADLISGCQEVLQGKEPPCKLKACQKYADGPVLTGKDAGIAATKRVRKAQVLIAKFLGESGVEGEGKDKITAYVKAHPY